MILLNKTDVAEDSDISRLQGSIRACNPSAPIYRTVKGQVELSLIIGINAYASRPFDSQVAALHTDGHCHSGDERDHDHETGSSRHGGVTSLQIDLSPLTAEGALRLDEWIRSVLWEGLLPENADCGTEGPKVEVLRCKGIFSVTDGGQFVLQGVRNLYEIAPLESDTESGLQVGKLVFIGKGLGEDVRRSLLKYLD